MLILNFILKSLSQIGVYFQETQRVMKTNFFGGLAHHAKKETQTCVNFKQIWIPILKYSRKFASVCLSHPEVSSPPLIFFFSVKLTSWTVSSFSFGISPFSSSFWSTSSGFCSLAVWERNKKYAPYTLKIKNSEDLCAQRKGQNLKVLRLGKASSQWGKCKVLPKFFSR